MEIKKVDIVSCVAIVLICVIASIYVSVSRSLREDNERLKQNQEALTKELNIWKDKDSNSVAQIETLKLTKDEFNNLYEQQANELKDMNIKLKRLLAYSQTALSHEYIVTDTIRDSIIIRENKIDTLTCVRYNDDYIQFNGCIDSGVFSGNIRTFDTITSIIHIIPKKFLWFKYGVKRVDNTVVSKNPYSRIENIKHIDIKK